MKLTNTAFFTIGLILTLSACQPDATNDPTPDTGGIDFVGTWNRDSVIVNDIYENGLKIRLETWPNLGVYIFNSDKQTGVMTHSGSDFAITWKYTSSSNSIVISEIDWINQAYQITQISSTKLILTGYLDTGGGNKNERILYLTKK